MKFTTGKSVSGEIPSQPPSAEVATQIAALATTVNTASTAVATLASANSFQGLSNFAAAKAGSLIFGPTAVYIASAALETGVPVSIDFSTGGLRAKAFTGGDDICLGFTTTSALAAGQDVTVALKGAFCTIKRKSDQRVKIRLTAALANVTTTNHHVRFVDSGDLDGNYNNSELYSAAFDAGLGGTWLVRADNWSLETSYSSMYDRLGIEYSFDNTTFYNVSVPWLWKSATSSSPWSTSPGERANGYLWAGTPLTHEQTGGYDTHPQTFYPSSRYIRLTFVSDGSETRPGWDIDLKSTLYGSNGTPLFLDDENPGFLGDTPNGSALAQIMSSNLEEDSVYALVL
jgi:hypothetical protein